MVLSVEHILAFGLESEVLPTNTAFVAAEVARFEVRGDRCTSMPQPCQLAAEPHGLTVDFRKPAAMAVMGPHHMSRIFESALQGRLPTHEHALVHWLCLQLLQDCARIVGPAVLLWGS